MSSEIAKTKPFIKWAGGKGQLIEQLSLLLPCRFDTQTEVTYIEPFVGGGAMLFYMLKTYPNIKKAVINDINSDLTTCYTVIKESPRLLIESLSEIQERYYGLATEEHRKEFFLQCRERFNTKQSGDIESVTLFLFLNRTCYNGLYRVNKAGGFNVPFGKYTNPLICDADTILADSQALQKVEILTGDFEQTFDKIDGNTFFYLDPPYRPISDTSSFNSYTKEAFNDEAQVRLKKFCDRLQKAGCHFMLSNSDSLNNGNNDPFFDKLFGGYSVERVWASRSINANATKRGKLTEILVHNYQLNRLK